MRSASCMTGFVFLLVTAASAVAQPPEGGQKTLDRIDRLKGAPLSNVRIVKEDVQGVTYALPSGRTQTIPAGEVVDVVRGDTPPVLREGKSKVLAGELRDAVGVLQLAAKDAQEAWVKEYASFYLGEAQRQLGKTDDAVRSYEAVLQAKPDSRFLPQVRLGIARAYIAADQHEKAASVLEGFTREVDAKQLPRRYALQARQLLGRNLQAQGKFVEAAREYESVRMEAQGLVSRAEGDAEKRALHLVELRAARDRGSALVQDKKYDEAERMFSELRSTRDDPLAEAIGLMGLGELDLARGQADRARVRLSEVVALHFAADEEVPRALRLLSETYLKLRDQGEPGAGKMAGIYIEDLIEDYPGSEEARIAQKLQQKLK